LEFETILRIVIDGLGISLLYAMIAVGLTLVFGVLGILNFAHGELIMVGGWAVWLLWAQGDVPFLVAVPLAMLIVAGMGVVIERFFYKPLRGNEFGGLLVSLGIAYILQVAALTIFGPVNKSVPTVFPGTVELWGTPFSITKLLTIPVAGGVLFLVWLFLERSRFGQAIRASSEDSEAASLYGISLDRMSILVMTIGCSLAGLAGVIITQWRSLGPQLGADIIVKAFVIVVIGGLGSIGGTIIGALIIGYLEGIVSNLLSPQVSVLFGVLMMFLILAIKPGGLFGRE